MILPSYVENELRVNYWNWLILFWRENNKKRRRRRYYYIKPFFVRSVEVAVELDRADKDDLLNKEKSKMMKESFSN